MNSFDNIIKGPITSILGLVIMGAAAGGWFIGYLPDWTHAAGFGGIGFGLLFMRDKIPMFISYFVKKKLGVTEKEKAAQDDAAMQDDNLTTPKASLIALLILIPGLLSAQIQISEPSSSTFRIGTSTYPKGEYAVINKNPRINIYSVDNPSAIIVNNVPYTSFIDSEGDPFATFADLLSYVTLTIGESDNPVDSVRIDWDIDGTQPHTGLLQFDSLQKFNVVFVDSVGGLTNYMNLDEDLFYVASVLGTDSSTLEVGAGATAMSFYESGVSSGQNGYIFGKGQFSLGSIDPTGGDYEVLIHSFLPTIPALVIRTQQTSAPSNTTAVGVFGAGVKIATQSNLSTGASAKLQVLTDAANESALLVQENGGTNYIECVEVSNAKRMGFFGATPVVQPANSVAINDALVSLGWRASGGNSSFSTSIRPPTGTTTIAPIQFTAGTNLTSATAGAMEFDGTNYFATASTTRYTLAKTLTNTGTIDFASTGAAAVTDATITVTGAATGMPCLVSPPAASVTATACFTCWVSATNTVTVRFSPKATEDPASGTYRVSVLAY